MSLTNDALREMAEAICAVDGVEAVALGGSRARGTARPDSDYDLGIYYRGELDVDALRAIAHGVAGPAELVARGAWGPWVDGGGWLSVGADAVDWIYRDIDRVEEIWERAVRGEYAFHRQAGHPLGFLDVAYVGEVALCVPLADRRGTLSGLRTRVARYPAALSDAFVAGLWEADFALEIAAKGAKNADTAYVAGCLFQAVSFAAHAIHGRAGRWVINEKGLITSASLLPQAPDDFATRCGAILGSLGTTPASLSAAIAAVRDLVAETRERVTLTA